MTRSSTWLLLACFVGLMASAVETQAVTFTDDAYISSADTTYDGTEVVVDGATVTIDGWHAFTSFYVINGGFVTHSVDDGTGIAFLTLSVDGDFLVDEGSQIDVSGRGGPLGTNLGDGTSGNLVGSGGGYGGAGGHATDGKVGLPGGTTYGVADNPVDCGSAGGDSAEFFGGRGGGFLSLEVGGTLTVDGIVSADGASGEGNGTAGAGGGSGGGIVIAANTLYGFGMITANGGSGGGDVAGGGGGGRIAVEVCDPGSLDFSFSVWEGYGGAPAEGSIFTSAKSVAQVIQHPQSASKTVGESVTFDVELDGDWDVSYQWYKEELPVADDGVRFIGAQTSSLTINDLMASDAGSYTVAVDSGCGPLHSESAMLTVSVFVDCNQNEINDSTDIQSGFSVDTNENGVPDECEDPSLWVISELQAIPLDGSVSLSWYPLPWVDGYVVEVYEAQAVIDRATAVVELPIATYDVGPVPAFQVPDLTNGTQYRFYVYAYVTDTANGPSSSIKSMPMGGMRGLLAMYSNGVEVYEGPIFHGYWSTADYGFPSCLGFGNHLYQGVCTSVSVSSVNWVSAVAMDVSWTGYIYAPASRNYLFDSGPAINGDVYIEIAGTVIADLTGLENSYNEMIYLSGGMWYPITMHFATAGDRNNMQLGWILSDNEVWEPVPRQYLAYIADCNRNNIDDAVDIANGDAQDCNMNSVPDVCDIAGGVSTDINDNRIPDECEEDCNGNSVPDDWDILMQYSLDANENGVPDECEPDCNGNGILDSEEIADDSTMDCNSNRVPDECDIVFATSTDINGNLIPDECEPDCNANRIPDDYEISQDPAIDCDGNGLIDTCEIAANPDLDVDMNTVLDACDLDCDEDGVPDGVALLSGLSDDCNDNGVPDLCDISAGVSQDCNDNGVPDECELDSDGDGVIDDCESQAGQELPDDGCCIPCNIAKAIAGEELDPCFLQFLEDNGMTIDELIAEMAEDNAGDDQSGLDVISVGPCPIVCAAMFALAFIGFARSKRRR